MRQVARERLREFIVMVAASKKKSVTRNSTGTKSRDKECETAIKAGTAASARDAAYRALLKKPVANISEEEFDAHFEGMPERYWQRVTEDELVWGLQTVHRFLAQLVSHNAGAPAVMDARHFPADGVTKLLVCTWDRLGLLTKLAGYMSALRLNVVRAEVFTRSDNIVLDGFWICDGSDKRPADAERLRQLAFLLDGGLSEPPRFVSAWAPQSHKFLPMANRMTPIVNFNNTDSSERTILTVIASERLGLLHDLLEVLSQNGLNITDACIDTVDEVARDILFVTDDHKRKITDPASLRRIENALAQALG